MKIIDTNTPVTAAIAVKLKAGGIETVIRYLTTATGSSKLVSSDEARILAAAGLKLGLVFENYGGVDNFKHGDINPTTGKLHAQFALAWAPKVGAPDGTIIWFAIDTDAASGSWVTLVRPYLNAVKDTLRGKYRLGLYANGYCCAQALDDGLADAAWLTQSMGWLGSKTFRDGKRWALLQGPETILHGLSVDSNEAGALDYGGFVPFAAPAQAPAEAAPVAQNPPAATPGTAAPQTAPVASAARIAGLLPGTVAAIVRAVVADPLISHAWHNGQAPRGYTKGMAVAFGSAYRRLKMGGDPVVNIMAGTDVGNSATDALAWYRSQFRALDMSNEVAGAVTLRHAIVLQTGLGMRESGGDYTEGRDITAHNVTADTAEAGLFQQSWNSRIATPVLPQLFAAERALAEDDEQSLRAIFKEGAKDRNLPSFGSGDGFLFQHLCKTRPLFAVLAAAVGLRTIGGNATGHGHWGPINRHEAEVLPIADALFAKVQAIVDTEDAVA